jgi:hypothetical protein
VGRHATALGGRPDVALGEDMAAVEYRVSSEYDSEFGFEYNSEFEFEDGSSVTNRTRRVRLAG